MKKQFVLYLNPPRSTFAQDMSDEELVELPGGLDQLEAIAEEYAKREEWLLPFSSHNN